MIKFPVLILISIDNISLKEKTPMIKIPVLILINIDNISLKEKG